MKKILQIVVLMMLMISLAEAKTPVFEGVVKDVMFSKKNSLSGYIDVKYKVSVFMGEPLVKVQGKYIFSNPTIINTKYGKVWYSNLPKEVQKDIRIYDVKVVFVFWDRAKHRKIVHKADLGAMDSEGEWSFNTPGSPSWGKFLQPYNTRNDYLSAKEAKKVFKRMEFQTIKIENSNYKTNTIAAELYMQKQQMQKELAKVKQKAANLPSKEDLDAKEANLKEKQEALSGENYKKKEQYLLDAIEEAKKRKDPQNEELFRKKLKGLKRANSYFKREFKKIKKENQKIKAYRKKLEKVSQKYERKIAKLDTKLTKREQKRQQKIAYLKKHGIKGTQEGVFIDESTGLMWQDDEIQDDMEFDESSFFIKIDSEGNMLMNPEYNEGKEKLIKTDDYCSYVRTGGYDDWYLPTVEQLLSLYKVKDKVKYINLDTYDDTYFSSETTTTSTYGYRRKSVNFDTIREKWNEVVDNVSSDSHIRCVRNLK